METISEHASFGGTVGFYKHRSDATNCDMRFSVFVPPQARDGKVPVLTFLSGLTCTEETFMIKSGAQRIAAKLGLMLITPDTSPRGEGVPDDPHGQYDFGLGAGFYLNATKTPWNHHYHMYDYVTRELNAVLFEKFPAERERHGITGHSMGGHGALTLGLRNPDLYHSISAFAPICSTLNCPWGHKALAYYLGEDRATWAEYDAVEVAKDVHHVPKHRILIDQGLADQYLDPQLNPELFEAACKARGIKLDLRRHKGYDHGYYFISTFMEDHLQHHASILTH
ncbi:MAG: S-formylglutathione hydrolase [Woeseia sp.]|nr:S-formylglutathione hydrolase [Woeseia sp.]MBT8097485.1 S-formylglutathione hydrolase [Woeseia sp.]NNE60885.1 S-formylglutathione hydrolase [Woeseia sp.]NNL55429.1 S-formylglutathione hydrolase [Woeseia sp.]